jgi:nucleoside-diphosphate-sugar epimerase
VSVEPGETFHDIGVPDTIQDCIYVENVVHGLLLVEDKLSRDGTGGRAYQISNSNNDLTYTSFNERLGEKLGRKQKNLPPRLVDFLGFIRFA